MKETEYTAMVQEVVNDWIEAVDEVVAKYEEQFGDIGDPETIMGKPYEEFTPMELQMLGQVYGAEPNPLSKLIAKKQIAKLEELEKEEINA